MALLMLPIPSSEQNILPDPPTLHLRTDLIEVPVLALRPPFRFVDGLLRSNFIISLDGGQSFHPSFVHTQGSESADFAILVDAKTHDLGILSSSLQSASSRWLEDLISPNDQLSLYITGCHLIHALDESSLVLRNAPDAIIHATSVITLQSAVKGGDSCRPPAMEEVLTAVMAKMKETTKWKVLLLVVNATRQLDTNIMQHIEIVAAAYRVSLFVVRYVDDSFVSKNAYSDNEGFNVLSASLGGISLVASKSDLATVTDLIFKDVRKRYIISFPRPVNGTAGTHSLQVTSTVRGVKVVSSAASAPPLSQETCDSDQTSSSCMSTRPRMRTKVPK